MYMCIPPKDLCEKHISPMIHVTIYDKATILLNFH